MENNEVPPSVPPESTEPPLDDYGIDHDRIIEICESLLQQMHNIYVIEQKKADNILEIQQATAALTHIWDLTQSILDIDDVIRSAITEIQDNPQSYIEDKDEDEDEDEEDNEETDDQGDNEDWKQK